MYVQVNCVGVGVGAGAGVGAGVGVGAGAGVRVSVGVGAGPKKHTTKRGNEAQLRRPRTARVCRRRRRVEAQPKGQRRRDKSKENG